MLQDLIELKEKGAELLHKGDLEGAKQAFTEAIGDLEVKNDNEALVKAVCLLNRSNIHMMQNNLGDSFEDASYVFYLFKVRRPKLDLTGEIPTDDKMVDIYAMAEQRKAEIYTEIDDFANAIGSFTIVGKLTHREPSELMEGVYSKLGFPKIDRNDKDLEVFSRIYSSLASEKDILTVLNDILTLFQETKLSDSLIKKIMDSGCVLFIFGVIHLFVDKKMVVLACLCILKDIAGLGIPEAYDGILVVRSLLDFYLEDKEVMGMMLKYLRNVPDSICTGLDMIDFLVPVMKALHMDLKPEESDAGFSLLFRMIKTKSDYEEALNNKVIDEIFKKATKSSILLLSKLCVNDKCLVMSHIKGSIPFSLAVIKRVKESLLITACLTIVANTLLMGLKDTDKFMPLIIETIVPVLVKNSKDAEIVSNGLACLSLAVVKAPNVAREQKVIKVVSLILLVHSKNKELLESIMNFFYSAAISGLAKDIAENPSTIATILQVATANISSEDIATKGIAIAIYCNHPSRIKLAEIGIRTYPKSLIILKAITSMKAEKEAKQN